MATELYIGGSETFELCGQVFRVTILHDEHADAPWDAEDGHGEVSEWTTRDKLPGELVLADERGRKRYYDFAGACKIARRDGWNAAPFAAPGTETKRQQAARAAMADFEYLRGYCNDDWTYCTVAVVALDDDGEPATDTDSVSGIESNAHEYLWETARDLAAGLIAPQCRTA